MTILNSVQYSFHPRFSHFFYSFKEDLEEMHFFRRKSTLLSNLWHENVSPQSYMHSSEFYTISLNIFLLFHLVNMVQTPPKVGFLLLLTAENHQMTVVHHGQHPTKKGRKFYLKSTWISYNTN